MSELYEIERHHTVLWKKVALGAGADQAVLGAPQKLDDNGTQDADLLAEYIVVRVEWSSTIGGTFVLRDGSADKESVRLFSGNAGNKEDVRIPIGRGKAITTTVVTETGLKLRIGYYIKKYGHSRSVPV